MLSTRLDALRIDSSTIQEALLPQTDRATRFVSINPVNCCTTVGQVTIQRALESRHESA